MQRLKVVDDVERVQEHLWRGCLIREASACVCRKPAARHVELEPDQHRVGFFPTYLRLTPSYSVTKLHGIARDIWAVLLTLNVSCVSLLLSLQYTCTLTLGSQTNQRRLPSLIGTVLVDLCSVSGKFASGFVFVGSPAFHLICISSMYLPRAHVFSCCIETLILDFCTSSCRYPIASQTFPTKLVNGTAIQKKVPSLVNADQPSLVPSVHGVQPFLRFAVC